MKQKNKVPPKLKYYNFKFEEVKESTFEERIAAVKEAGKQAKKDFIIKYQNVNNWFNTDYDQLYILSFCMRYFLMHEVGYDEEAEKGHLSFAPYYLELLQAIALSHKRIFSARPLWDEVEKLRDDMKEIGNLIQLKLFDFPEPMKTEEEFHAYKIRTDVMGYHMAVRNWAYVPQMKKVAEDMALTLQAEFYAMYHADPVELIKLHFELCHEMEVRVNKHIQKIGSAIKHKDHIQIQEAYQKVFGTDPSNKTEMEKFWKMCGKKINVLRAMLLAHSDLRLTQLFTFTIDELAVMSNNTLNKESLTVLFDKVSYQFGDLGNYLQEHIILDNPVHDRPFIKIGEQEYFTSIWTTLPHLTLLMLENLVRENDDLRNKYNDQRAKYLEDQVELLCRNSFTGAQIFKGSKWIGIDGKQYENDLLVIIDSFALVVESKSGTVTKSARRGAPERLAKTLRELVEEPSDQALRFIEYLKANKGPHMFNTKGVTKNHVDSRAINYFIPIGVTFYHLGVVGTNLKQLINSGIINKKIHELAPSISLTDLQVVFEILDTDAQKIHYLQRRREFETQVQYIADELDLLGFYLDAGFNIGDMDNEPCIFDLSLKSKELDPYFLTKNEVERNEKPSLKMTAWWKAILSRLEEIRNPRWLEFSYVLLNMNIDAQEQFEEGFNKLVNKIKKNEVEERHNWLAFWTAKEERRYVVIAYP